MAIPIIGGWRIHRKAETDSTNLDARDGLPGDVFTAGYQTAGRGRLDHRWLSPPGVNLTMSVVLADGGRAPEEVCTLPLVVGLAVCRALASEVSVPVGLKWPNDVWIGGRKAAGILCERRDERIIAGIGVNVRQRAFAAELADRATSLAREGSSASPETVMRAVLDRLERAYGIWRRDGFAAVHPDLAAVDVLKGRFVSVRQTDEDSAPLRGLCGGIMSDGTLDVGGTRVYAGEAHVEEIA